MDDHAGVGLAARDDFENLIEWGEDRHDIALIELHREKCRRQFPGNRNTFALQVTGGRGASHHQRTVAVAKARARRQQDVFVRKVRIRVERRGGNP